MLQGKKITLTEDDVTSINALIKAIKTRIELIEKLVNENAREQPSAVPGSFGE